METIKNDVCGLVNYERDFEMDGKDIDAQIVLLQYLDNISGDKNGVLTAEEWNEGIILFNQWRQDFYYNLDMIVAVLDRNKNGEVKEAELEAALELLCPYWSGEAESWEITECESEPQEFSVSYDICEMEERLFQVFFGLADGDNDGVVQFYVLVMLYQAFNPTLEDIKSGFDLIGCGHYTWDEAPTNIF
jgi:hypothetical protein